MRHSPDSLPWELLGGTSEGSRMSGQPESWHCRGDWAQLVVTMASTSPATQQWPGSGRSSSLWRRKAARGKVMFSSGPAWRSNSYSLLALEVLSPNQSFGTKHILGKKGKLYPEGILTLTLSPKLCMCAFFWKECP